MGRPPRPPAERLAEKTNQNGPVVRPELGPCWQWTGGCFVSGYGQIKVAGKPWKAHRLAWTLTNGEVPDGLFVLHRCDNPKCVRLDHLFLGTNADNSADMVAKGRQATGERHMSRTRPDKLRRGDNHPSRLHPERLARGDKSGARLHPERLARGDRNGARLYPERLRRGEQHERHKLTEQAVREIRALYAAGDYTQVQLGERYGVTSVLIGYVVRRKIWRHVA